MKSCIPLALEWYSKTSDKFIGSELICIANLLALKLVKEEEYSVIAGMYDVDAEIADNLQPYFSHKIMLNNYDYFVTSYGDYECRDGVPVEVPYDLSWYHKKIGLVSDEEP